MLFSPLPPKERHGHNQVVVSQNFLRVAQKFLDSFFRVFPSVFVEEIWNSSAREFSLVKSLNSSWLFTKTMISTEEAAAQLEELFGIRRDVSEGLLNLVLYVVTSLDQFHQVIEMRTGLIFLSFAIALAGIRAKLTVDGIQMTVGPFDLDDCLEVIVEYAVLMFMTLIYGSDLWIMIGVCYNLRNQKYTNLSFALVLVLLKKVYVVKRKLGWLARILIFLGIWHDVDPLADSVQLALGFFVMLYAIFDLRKIGR